MSNQRAKELLKKLIYFISEELDEEDIYEWYAVMFGITQKEMKELEIDF